MMGEQPGPGESKLHLWRETNLLDLSPVLAGKGPALPCTPVWQSQQRGQSTPGAGRGAAEPVGLVARAGRLGGRTPGSHSQPSPLFHCASPAPVPAFPVWQWDGEAARVTALLPVPCAVMLAWPTCLPQARAPWPGSQCLARPSPAVGPDPFPTSRSPAAFWAHLVPCMLPGLMRTRRSQGLVMVPRCC